MFTPGNVDDREPLYSESFIENIKGRLCGDVSSSLPKSKNNMRNSLMSVPDNIMLRKRALLMTDLRT